MLATVAVAVPLGIAVGYGLKSGPAIPVLSTDLVAFGDVPVGTAVEQEARIQNDGEADLVVRGWRILEADSPAFSVVPSPECEAVALPASTACTVRIRFSPTGTEPAQARLEVVTGDGERSQSQTIPLLGRGIAPELGLEPSRVDFGEATVGYRGERRSIFLHNRGSAPLRIAAVRLQGLGAADFVRFGDKCSGTELPPDGRCEVGFELVPTTDGERRATVEVVADAPAPTETPVLIGHGRPQIPLLVLQPQRLDFGALRLGERARPQEVTVRNDGNGPLEIRSIRVAAPEAAERRGDTLRFRSDDVAASFPFEDLGCAGASLDPGESCSFLVAFEPLLEESMGALVRIEHSAAAGGYRLPVVGTGTAPRLRLSTPQVAFGEMSVGRPSPWRSVELRNEGSADLRVERLSLRGTDARWFELAADGCTRAPIPPGQSCAAQVRFQGRRDGPHRAEIEIRHDAGDGRDRLAINGIGVSARLSVEPERLDFASVRIWQQRTLSLRLSNGGRAPLTVERMDVSGSIARHLQLLTTCAGQTLGPGQSCVAELRYSPNSAGTSNGRLTIRHDGDSRPKQILLQADALPEAP